MSLYLCVFAGNREVDGIDAGSYADFNAWRAAIVRELGASAHDRFPTVLTHADCDGEWSPRDCARLAGELAAIAAGLKARPPVGFPTAWQRAVARPAGLEPRNAFECFIDVDGEFLVDRLQCLAAIAVEQRLPILFQ